MAAKKKTSKKKAKKKVLANSKGIPRGQGRKKAKKKGGPPKGNQFWLVRSTHGRKPIFQDPEELLDACIQYFQWAEANPLMEVKYLAGFGKVKIPHMRALTMGGLYIFVDINRQTWANYKKIDDYLAITEWAEEYIREQKFTGAAAGFLNANIIARDLGLVDKKEHGSDPQRPLVTISTDMTADEATAIYRTLLDG